MVKEWELYHRIHDLYWQNQELETKVKEKDLEIERLNKIRKQALEIIYNDWNGKTTIPIEKVGISSDIRVKLFKVLIQGEDKE